MSNANTNLISLSSSSLDSTTCTSVFSEQLSPSSACTSHTSDVHSSLPFGYYYSSFSRLLFSPTTTVTINRATVEPRARVQNKRVTPYLYHYRQRRSTRKDEIPSPHMNINALLLETRRGMGMMRRKKKGGGRISEQKAQRPRPIIVPF